ncbi:MAG: flagellar hook-length control protein FliK [Lachnospiraceae bacterium]
MQVNESVNASNFLLVGANAGSSKSGSKADDTAKSSDFASFLTTSSNEQTEFSSKTEKTSGGKTAVSKNQDVSSKKNVEDKTDNKKTEDVSDNRVDNKDKTVKDVSQTENVDETQQTAVMDENMKMTDEEISEVLESVGNILQMIMQQFDLSMEDLQGQLEVFDMELSDLTTEDGLKTFFLNMNSADVADLITDEGLNQELQSFMQEWNQILQENDITQEDMVEILTGDQGKELLSNFSGFEELRDSEDIPISDSVGKEMQENSSEPEVVVTVTGRQQTGNAAFEQNADAKKDMSDGTAQSQTADSKETTAKEPNKFENPILQEMQNAINQTEETPVVSETTTGRSNIIEQIVEQVRVNMNQSTTSMELQLYPEHLGKIQINVVSKDGVMTARIAAETETAKQAIESGLSNLKEALDQQNLKVDAIEVMVSTAGFERGDERQSTYQQESTRRNGRKLNLSELDDETTTEEEAELEKMRASGSSVSYMA